VLAQINAHPSAALQVSAAVGGCTFGRTGLQPTSTNPRPGLLIDLETPAPCSGQIVKWNLCYYNYNLQSSLPISLHVWRLDEEQKTGVRVAAFSTSVAIQLPASDFQCVSIPLSEAEYMNVTAGDFLGVRLTTDKLLPVVADANIQGQTPQLLFVEPEAIAQTEIMGGCVCLCVCASVLSQSRMS